jgi:NDP-sugar pyrophosphorylase family protein
MQGVILAAGQGSRLHPITRTRSKAMMPILGKPIVERVMEHLVANGVKDFILVVSPDDHHITQYFGAGPAPLPRQSKIEAGVRFAYQTERLGMAHALQCAAPLISGDFVLSACDNLISAAHMGRLIQAMAPSPETTPSRPNAVLTLMPVEPERLGSGAIVEMDGSWITRIMEKPRPEEAPSDIASLPLYCFSRRILDYLPQVSLSPRGEYELQDAIQMLIERDGYVGGVTVHRRLTLTSPADLLAINQHYLNNSTEQDLSLCPRAVGPNTNLITPLRIESGATIGANCTIGPNAYLERNCRIGDGVTIQNAMILCGTTVPDGTVVQEQVL